MSFPRYESYKDSGIEWLGEVPGHWEVRRLKKVVTLQRGHDLPGEIREEGDIPIISSGGYFGTHNQAQAKAPGIVTGRYGTIGEFIFVEQDYWPLNTTLYSIKMFSNVPRFVWYLLQSISEHFVLNSKKSAISGVDRNDVHPVQVVLPPLKEQLPIAAFLDYETTQIDALIAEQQKLIALLKEKRQAVISHAVTKGLDPTVPMKDSGIEWLGKVPEHWEVGNLKRFWMVTDCKHITAEFVDEGIPLVSIREVQSRYVNLENAKQTTNLFYTQLIESGRKPQPGDLIFSRNATVGEVAQVADWHPPFAMGQDVCLLRKQVPELSTNYLQEVIRSPLIVEQLENLMVGSTFKRINVEEIRNLVVLMPPIEEQSAITTFLEQQTAKIDELTAEAQRGIELLKERRSALISAAVTGKIDVRGWTPPEAV